MEDNTISMFMDVKLDIRERKLEFSHMKSWSRYFVRVEAVKCFPCYMRISFFASPTDLATDLIVRINIPGLTVQMATSRTKQHSYGLFWKNNRKRCCAYFALETQLLCERHLRWMKKSIRNLELYRQEMMQFRRASRTPLYEIRQEMQPLDPLAAMASPEAWDDLGIYQNLDNTQNIMGLQDILGPLPTVPPSVERGDSQTAPHHTSAGANCSRRVSGMSGIYEEIRDTSAAIHARLSRVSIASGIYEEMKLGVDGQEDGSTPSSLTVDEYSSPPPPLPPRPRSNTNEDFDLERSFTTPEVDLMKKKRHWLRLDSMFGRRRTTSTDSQGSGTGKKRCSKGGKARTKPTRSGEALVDADAKHLPPAVVHRDKVSRLRLAENKRNSFSSPDLSRLKIDECHPRPGDVRTSNESFENLSDGIGSCTSEFYPQQHDVDYIDEDCCFASLEFINMSTTSSLGSATPATAEGDGEFERSHGEEDLDPLRNFRRMNISERIFDSFNRSVNSSTVNLVGAGCNTSPISETNETEKAPRVPGPPFVPAPAQLSDADMVGYLEMGPAGTGFNRQKLEEVVYRNHPPRTAAVCGPDTETKVCQESIYMSMDGCGKLPEPIRSSSTSSSSSSSSGVSSASELSCITEGSGKHRNSVDDKIPSYYPNEEFVRTPSRKGSAVYPSPTDGKRSPNHARDKATAITTPVAAVATTLPRTIRSAQRGPSEAAVELHDHIHATFRTPKAARARPCSRTFLQVPESRVAAVESSTVEGCVREPSPKLYQKYATLARIASPSRYSTKSKPVEHEASTTPGEGPVSASSSTTTPTTPVGSGRRFGSLPRFGKIDLSPLRMKINSVLQRHNSGNL